MIDDERAEDIEADYRLQEAGDAIDTKAIHIDDEVLDGIRVCCVATLEADEWDQPTLASLDAIYASVTITDSHGEKHEDINLKDNHPLAIVLWKHIEACACEKWLALGVYERWD